MSRTECPKNWTDHSELEDGEWEYKFTKTITGATLKIQQIQWMGQTDWTVLLKKDSELASAKLGNADTLAQALEMAETAAAPTKLEWNGMRARDGDTTFDIIAKKNGKFFVKVYRFKIAQSLPFQDFETVGDAKTYCANLKI